MQITVIVPASGEIKIDVPARFFYVKNVSTVGATFRLKAAAENFEIDEVMEKGSKLSFLPEVVDVWTIRNNQATQLTITIKTGLVYYEEDSVISGSVDVMSMPHNSGTGKSIYRGVFQRNFVNFGSFVIHNPNTSGVKTIIRELAGHRGPVGTAALRVAIFRATGIPAGAITQKTYSNEFGESPLRSVKAGAVAALTNVYYRDGVVALSGTYPADDFYDVLPMPQNIFDNKIYSVRQQGADDSDCITLASNQSLIIESTDVTRSFGFSAIVEEVSV